MVTRKVTKDRADVCAHFGLHHLPFTREISIADCWHHPQYDGLVDELHELVEHRLSAAIIAPAGAGKTVVLRALRESLGSARSFSLFLFRWPSIEGSFCSPDQCRVRL